MKIFWLAAKRGVVAGPFVSVGFDLPLFEIATSIENVTKLVVIVEDAGDRLFVLEKVRKSLILIDIAHYKRKVYYWLEIAPAANSLHLKEL